MDSRHFYLILGFLLSAILVVLGYWFIDKPVAAYCLTLNQGIVDIFQWITALGVSTGYLVFFFILFIYFRFYKRKLEAARRALFIFLSVAISGIIAIIVKSIAGRFRPSMLFKENLYGFDFFRIGHEYNSFPSGHAVTVFALAAAFSTLFPKYRLLFYGYALIVSASRVIINTHYFSDTIAGAYIGVMSVILLNCFFRQPEKNQCIEYDGDFENFKKCGR